MWLLWIGLIGIGLMILILVKSSSKKAEKYGYGWPYELPPLNYFESPESNILSFFYDPVVASDTGEQTTWGFSREEEPGTGTNIDQVFGPDSYVRYYAEDIDVGQV